MELSAVVIVTFSVAVVLVIHIHGITHPQNGVVSMDQGSGGPKGATTGHKKCIFRHGDDVHFMPCDANLIPKSSLDQNATVIEVDEYPSDTRLWPEVGNGHVATAVKSDSIFMNGLYNGKGTDSHRARIPSSVSVSITSITPSVTSKKYVLDLGRGTYFERYDAAQFYVELRLYAHRTLLPVVVVEVIVAEKSTSPLRKEDIVVNLQLNNGTDTDDIKWTHVDDSGTVTMKKGVTMSPEYSSIAPALPVGIFYSDIPTNLTLPVSLSKMDAFLVSSISTSQSNAIDGFNTAMDLMMNGTLYSSHVSAWADLWNRGRVDVEGNLTMARINYASLYYLTSSLPLAEVHNWPFVGMSPGGLAHGQGHEDYMGHVFWDQDTWMYPPIMMLHSDLGRKIIGTRIRTLSTAQLVANMTGYQGARYPWESGFTGLEVSPSKTCGGLEQHITGDVALAFRQFLQLTKDKTFLTKERGLEAIVHMADFWASRVTLNNSTKLWEIHDVMPPDEWHYHVNNSVYTNTVAKLSLLTGIYAMNMVGKTPPSSWQDIVDNMYIPFDVKLQYHPEFDGYKQGTDVKQADVVMLGFPLMSQSPQQQVQINDLTIYEKSTPGGPAMTWGIYVINWLELGNQSKADSLFQRTSLNAQPPFYIWTENADGSGAVNFHTGMGGYLQAIIFGYGGFRIEETQLSFNPNLPPSITRYMITGIDYLGNSLDLEVDHVNMTLTATLLSLPMEVKLSKGQTESLELNQPKTFPRQKAALVVQSK